MVAVLAADVAGVRGRRADGEDIESLRPEAGAADDVAVVTGSRALNSCTTLLTRGLLVLRRRTSSARMMHWEGWVAELKLRVSTG